MNKGEAIKGEERRGRGGSERGWSIQPSLESNLYAV